MDKPPKEALKFVVGTQYFVYFGVLGIFLPYFNLYCYHLGFSGFQIGVLSALRTAATVLFPLLWGVLADRFLIRKPIYIFCNFISTALWALYLYTVDFWLMLAITVSYGIFYAPLIAFLEAFTMDVLDSEKKSYGKIRVWGSISFITLVVIVGRIIDIYSVKIILLLILGGSLIQAALSTTIPDIRIKKERPSYPKVTVLLSRRVIVFFFCAFLMLVSHGAYYGFFSIHLENLGYGNTFIGIAWALASASEILVMINSDKIFKRFSLVNVLVFSFLVAAIRWFALYFAKTPALILITQVFHAITYGSFHIASILYIDFLTPDEAKTLGQAFNNSVTYGLGIMVGFFLTGYLYERTGSFALFAMSGMIALAGGLLLGGFEMIDRRTDRS
ncbi:MFS transporter [Thermodesulfobacteriota bacterium]